jgi:predicted AlkP superfamily pyrophosphatase or phosphodiesterase
MTPRPTAKRVLIISVDGLRPDAIALAPMPNLLALMQAGAYTLSAQTIFPSVTLPSHASMLTGLCPAQTGVDWNDYLPQRGFAKGTSLFALAKQAGLHTVMMVGKKKLRQITPPETTDVFQFINDRDVVLADQAAPTLEKGFDLAFVHLATTDDMGHAYGWLSPQQISVIIRADEAIGTFLAALDQADLRKDTLILVTADHGGHQQTHGSKMPEDMTIPWMINGPGVVPQVLTQPINTTDTAATAAWALHLAMPAEAVGRPILEAFGETAGVRLAPRCP